MFYLFVDLVRLDITKSIRHCTSNLYCKFSLHWFIPDNYVNTEEQLGKLFVHPSRFHHPGLLIYLFIIISGLCIIYMRACKQAIAETLRALWLSFWVLHVPVARALVLVSVGTWWNTVALRTADSTVLEATVLPSGLGAPHRALGIAEIWKVQEQNN